MVTLYVVTLKAHLYASYDVMVVQSIEKLL